MWRIMTSLCRSELFHVSDIKGRSYWTWNIKFTETVFVEEYAFYNEIGARIGQGGCAKLCGVGESSVLF